tara:strand:+ start:454 stop:810 length:357 start_codon:yes stop_codon:yes gene_type:complete
MLIHVTNAACSVHTLRVALGVTMAILAEAALLTTASTLYTQSHCVSLPPFDMTKYGTLVLQTGAATEDPNCVIGSLYYNANADDAHFLEQCACQTFWARRAYTSSAPQTAIHKGPLMM